MEGKRHCKTHITIDDQTNEKTWFSQRAIAALGNGTVNEEAKEVSEAKEVKERSRSRSPRNMAQIRREKLIRGVAHLPTDGLFSILEACQAKLITRVRELSAAPAAPIEIDDDDDENNDVAVNNDDDDENSDVVDESEVAVTSDVLNADSFCPEWERENESP